jgi:hypothetical protein
MGIEEGKEMQAKGIGNIVIKTISENFSVLRNIHPSRYRKLPGHQTDMHKIKPLHSIL